MRYPKMVARLGLYYYREALRSGTPRGDGALLLLSICRGIENWVPGSKVQLPLDVSTYWAALAVLYDLEPETAAEALIEEVKRLCA